MRMLSMLRRMGAVPAVASAALLAGCLDLEERIISGVTSSYYETPAGFEAAVNAAYSGLHSLYAQERHMTIEELGTDIWVKGADGSHKQFNDYTPALNPTTAYVREQWDATYQAINTANAVIQRSEGLTGVSEDHKRTRVAEARFLRAMFYFYLVRMYGDVHVTLEETTGVVTEARRTPVAEVYANVIIPDLEFAEQNLPETQADYGRATKWAAKSLLAHVYLTRGAPGDMDRAFQYANEVINSGQFQLLPNYADLFDINNERNAEVIFSVQFTNDPLTTGAGNRWHLYFLMEYDREPGMTRTIEYGRPFKRLRPTEHLLYLWDREKDVRYEASFQHVWFVNNPDPSRGLAMGDTSIFLPAVKTSELPDEYKTKNYRVFTEPDDYWNPKPISSICNCAEYDYRYFPSLLKHQDPTRTSINEERGQRDFVVFRLANIYLMAAEAAVRAGRPEDAVPYLNAVRRRAAKPGFEDAMTITAADVDLDFVMDERARELAGEGGRFYDLTRQGADYFVERVRKYNLDAAPLVQPFHALRPIPQTQIDRTMNADGTPFGQNPGY